MYVFKQTLFQIFLLEKKTTKKKSGLPTASMATALISRSPYFMELSYFYLVKTKILFFYNKKVYMACNLYVF